MVIKKGEECPLDISLVFENSDLDVDDIERALFVLNGIKKYYPGDVTYDSETGLFSYPMLQSESLLFRPDFEGCVHMDIYLKFVGTDGWLGVTPSLKIGFDSDTTLDEVITE